MISKTLRNNDKMNSNYAMIRWKKKIQLIRELYLKSLQVKQIKSSKIVKMKMNNQAKLRASLLKWLMALAPVKYLDRIKQNRMKKCIDIRRSKLGDTRKMKNKISNLLDDYLYQEKIHDGLITNPDKIILESMINYDKLKNEQAKKINGFTKGIL